ncbi:MAG TPA: glycosyltransferase family 4 protein [Gaiellaceae bacterium]|nr:glycosyltransferase family 4 protein [Gaiellaceae bacterium]
MRIFVPSAAALLTDRAGHGEGLIAWNVLSGLAARGHELTVCAREVALDAEPPFRLVRIGRRSRFESIEPLAYAHAVAAELERTRAAGGVDVVHWLYPAEPEQTVFAPPTGIPFVLGPVFRPWTNGRGRPFRAGDAVRLALAPVERVRRRTALGAATLLLATPDAAPAGTVVPPGVDLSRFEPRPPAGETVLFLGRLTEAKGVRELVEAFTRVAAERPGARLVLAGEGPEAPWVERRAAELGIAGRVHLAGAVAQADVPRLLAESALFCLPSHGEPYGMVLLEAMAAGRAVVATDSGGPRFVVPDGGGRLVPVGDRSALADALGALLADPDALAAMGRRNREHAERELSLERMLDRLEEVYAGVTR